MKKDVLLATCFGLGRLPWAPATWASLPPVVLYQVLGYLGPEFNVYVMGAFVVAGCVMYLSSAPSARRALGPQAGQQIVVDKLAGQALVLLMIALLEPVEICNSMALGFASFRVVDIVTIQLIQQRSNTYSSSRNLMATLASAAIAGVLCLVVSHMMPVCFIRPRLAAYLPPSPLVVAPNPLGPLHGIVNRGVKLPVPLQLP